MRQSFPDFWQVLHDIRGFKPLKESPKEHRREAVCVSPARRVVPRVAWPSIPQMTTNIVQNLPKVGFPVALATKPKKSQKRVPNPVFRKGCLGTERPPALFESDSSFARGFGETNRARGGLGNWDVSRETFVLLLLMFHVKHSALPRTGEEGRGGLPPSCACGGARLVGGAPAGAIGGRASRT